MLERLDNRQRREALRWKYGLPSKGNANFALVRHVINQVSPNSFAGFVLANGSMSSNQSGEGDKGDEEIAEPSGDNIKKHEYATDHFKRLNQWLEKAKIPTRYQFNMISPKSYNVFFQKLRDGGVVGFRSDLDVAMTKAAKSAS